MVPGFHEPSRAPRSQQRGRVLRAGLEAREEAKGEKSPQSQRRNRRGHKNREKLSNDGSGLAKPNAESPKHTQSAQQPECSDSSQVHRLAEKPNPGKYREHREPKHQTGHSEGPECSREPKSTAEPGEKRYPDPSERTS